MKKRDEQSNIRMPQIVGTSPQNNVTGGIPKLGFFSVLGAPLNRTPLRFAAMPNQGTCLNSSLPLQANSSVQFMDIPADRPSPYPQTTGLSRQIPVTLPPPPRIITNLHTMQRMQEIEFIPEPIQVDESSPEKPICVINKTAIVVNYDEYKDKKVKLEWISGSELSNRRLRVKNRCVLKGTAIEVNRDDYKGREDKIEMISGTALSKRKTSKIKSKCVLKDTTTVVKDKDYIGREDEIEWLTLDELSKKRGAVKSKCVLKDTIIVVNPNHYKNKPDEIEFISPIQLSVRKRKSATAKKPLTLKRKNIQTFDNTNTKKRKCHTSVHQADQDIQITEETNRKPVKSDQETSEIRIKVEEGTKTEPYTPVLTLNEDEFRTVAKNLRGNTRADGINCAFLAEDFITYLNTKKIPKQATSSQTCSFKHFMTIIEWEENPVQVKIEPGLPVVVQPVVSVISRDSDFYVPPGKGYLEKNNQIDLNTVVYDLNNHNQTKCDYKELDTRLRDEAINSSAEVSFGIVNLGHCGKYIKNPGHMIVYFATADKVVYIDCQRKDPLFNRLEEGFKFLSSAASITGNTFSDNVFYVPLIKNHLLTFESMEHEAFNPPSPSVYNQAHSPTLFGGTKSVDNYDFNLDPSLGYARKKANS